MTHNPLCTCLSNPESDGLGSRECTCYPYCEQLRQQDFHTAHTLTLSSCEAPQNSLHSHLNKNTQVTPLLCVNAELQHNSLKGYLLKLSVEFITRSIRNSSIKWEEWLGGDVGFVRVCRDVFWWCEVVVLFLSKS